VLSHLGVEVAIEVDLTDIGLNDEIIVNSPSMYEYGRVEAIAQNVDYPRIRLVQHDSGEVVDLPLKWDITRITFLRVLIAV